MNGNKSLLEEFDVNNLIGMTLQEAGKYLKQINMRIRAIRIDDKPAITTRDLDAMRLNVEIAHGHITRIVCNG